MTAMVFLFIWAFGFEVIFEVFPRVIISSKDLIATFAESIFVKSSFFWRVSNGA